MNQLNTQKFMNLFNDILSDKNGSSTSVETLKLLLKPENVPVKGDEVDLAQDQKEKQLSSRLDQRNVLFLKKVEAAKQKILAGEYGICEDCGSEITQKRLSARPTACLCIGCQEEKEREQFNNFKHRRDLSAMKEAEISVDGHIDRKTKFASMKTIGFESIVDM